MHQCGSYFSTDQFSILPKGALTSCLARAFFVVARRVLFRSRLQRIRNIFACAAATGPDGVTERSQSLPDRIQILAIAHRKSPLVMMGANKTAHCALYEGETIP